MSVESCGNCGNAFEGDKAKKEVLIIKGFQAAKADEPRDGRQTSCICPQCGTTGAGRTFEAVDPLSEDGYGEIEEVLPVPNEDE